MGNIPGAPDLSGEMEEVKKITLDFGVAFTKNYGKLYVLGLMEQSKRTLRKKQAAPKWVLMKYDSPIEDPVRKQGHMLKCSKHLKKWNDRYFVVRGNYLVDYYMTEDDHAKGKKRGTINMGAYQRVVDDPNNHGLRKLMAMAEKCGMNMDDIPKPDPYPEKTILCEHDRKEVLKLQCVGDENDFKDWSRTLERCRYFAPCHDQADDRIHCMIFRDALWRTRWDVGMWGWFSSGGGEVNMIAECINDQIEWQVLGRVDSKITGAWAIRQKIRNAFIAQVDTFVTAGVKPVWAGAYEAVKKIRPEIEGKLETMMEPIVEAQTKLITEINKFVESVAKDALKDKVTPHLQPLLELLFAPIIDSMRKVMAAFDKSLENGQPKFQKHEKNFYLVQNCWWTNEFWEAERLLWDLYDILWDMRKVFDDVYPWGILYKARRRCQKLICNALYTFETLHNNGKSWEEARSETRAMLAQDCQKAVAWIAGRMLEGVVDCLWTAVVVKPARDLVRPVADMVPDALKDFCDVDRLLVEVLKAVLRSSCMMVFEPFTSKVAIA
jgi:hypothetical protein